MRFVLGRVYVEASCSCVDPNSHTAALPVGGKLVVKRPQRVISKFCCLRSMAPPYAGRIPWSCDFTLLHDVSDTHLICSAFSVSVVDNTDYLSSPKGLFCTRLRPETYLMSSSDSAGAPYSYDYRRL